MELYGTPYLLRTPFEGSYAIKRVMFSLKRRMRTSNDRYLAVKIYRYLYIQQYLHRQFNAKRYPG
jgi:hypothetical protein